MAPPIIGELKKLWDVWDIPICVLLSLFLQVFLVLFASLRQRNKNSFLLFLIWSAYLSADWIAAFTVGLITKVLTDPLHPHHVNDDLYAFWASFLLLHLGGPDAITSFALEDNEFWLRHLFGLILQCVSAGYCFFLILPNNTLWLPTIIVFFVGSVKYAERTLSLYLASLDHFEDTISDFREPNAEPEPELDFEPDLEPHFGPHPEPSNHMELLMVSYSLFKNFKGIIFGNPLRSQPVMSSAMLFFQIKNPKVVFKLIEYELSFIYEVFHTKAAVVRSRMGSIFRFSSFCFIVGAFLEFHFSVNKEDKFGGLEMSVTYTLLIGAIGLDIISGIKLFFSDWIMVSDGLKRWRKFVPEYVLKRRRWCESVSQYSMIDYCLNERWLWKYNLPNYVRVMVDRIKIMLFPSSLDNIEDVKSFFWENRKEYLKWATHNVFRVDLPEMGLRYTEIVLEMHLVTEICYHPTKTESSKYTEEGKRRRRLCKVISDYMFYLLITKPGILGSSVMGETFKEANWQITFQETFKEAKSYLMECQISDHLKACNAFINYNNVKEKEQSATAHLLSKACSSAQELSLNQEEHWKDLSIQWVKVVAFGVLKTRPILHAEQVSKGGELLSFIWFLLHHLGESGNLENQYYKEEDEEN